MTLDDLAGIKMEQMQLKIKGETETKAIQTGQVELMTKLQDGQAELRTALQGEINALKDETEKKLRENTASVVEQIAEVNNYLNRLRADIFHDLDQIKEQVDRGLLDVQGSMEGVKTEPEKKKAQQQAFSKDDLDALREDLVMWMDAKVREPQRMWEGSKFKEESRAQLTEGTPTQAMEKDKGSKSNETWACFAHKPNLFNSKISQEECGAQFNTMSRINDGSIEQKQNFLAADMGSSILTILQTLPPERRQQYKDLIQTLEMKLGFSDHAELVRSQLRTTVVKEEMLLELAEDFQRLTNFAHADTSPGLQDHLAMDQITDSLSDGDLQSKISCHKAQMLRRALVHVGEVETYREVAQQTSQQHPLLKNAVGPMDSNWREHSDLTCDAPPPGLSKDDPTSYTCRNCKKTFTCAWSLLQHAQKIHGLSIYSENEHASSPVLKVESPIGLGTECISHLPPHGSYTAENNSQAMLRLPERDSRESACSEEGHLPPMLPSFSLPQKHYLETHHLSTEEVTLTTQHPGASQRVLGARSMEPPAKDFSRKFQELAKSPSTPPLSPIQLDSMQWLLNPIRPGYRPPAMAKPPRRLLQTARPPPQGRRKSKSCEFCGKTFEFPSRLAIHLRCHTGEKPYKCQICTRAFAYSSMLKRHMKTQTHKDSAVVAKSNDGTSATSSPDLACSGSSGHKLVIPKFKGKNGCNMILEDGDEDKKEEEGEMTENESRTNTVFGISFGAACYNGNNSISGEENQSVPEVMPGMGLCTMQQHYRKDFCRAREDQPKREHLASQIHAHSDTCDEDSVTGDSNDFDDSRVSSPGELSIVGLSKKLPLTQPSSLNPFPKRIKLEKDFNITITTIQNFQDVYLQWLAEHLNSRRLRNPSLDFGEFRQSPIASSEHSSEDEGLQLPTPPRDTDGGISADSDARSDGSKQHMSDPCPRRTSSKEGKSNICEFCGKTCYNLTLHRKRHTGERPFKCMICNYATIQSSALSRHMKTHCRVGKDIYECEICRMPFAVYKTLEKHMKQWHRE